MDNAEFRTWLSALADRIGLTDSVALVAFSKETGEATVAAAGEDAEGCMASLLLAAARMADTEARTLN